MDDIQEETTNEQEWQWCLVGNIVEEHEFGEDHVIKYGTKHFRPGAKVYINLVYGGMGYENIHVIGVPRRSKKYIEIVIRRKYVRNFRVQKVYRPAVLKMMSASKWAWSGNDEQTRESLEKSAEWMNAEAAENEKSRRTDPD